MMITARQTRTIATRLKSTNPPAIFSHPIVWFSYTSGFDFAQSTTNGGFGRWNQYHSRCHTSGALGYRRLWSHQMAGLELGLLKLLLSPLQFTCPFCYSSQVWPVLA